MKFTVSHLHPNLIFGNKAGAYPSGATKKECWLLNSPATIRLGWKWLKMTIAPTYCNTESIAAVKSFTVQARGEGHLTAVVRGWCSIKRAPVTSFFRLNLTVFIIYKGLLDRYVGPIL